MSEAIDDIEHAIERASDVLHDSRYWKDDGVYAAYITPALERLSAALTVATQRAEAAEAECKEALTSLDKSRAFKNGLLVERNALRAENDGMHMTNLRIMRELAEASAECEALRKDVALLDWLDTKRGPYSRRPMREVIGSEWRIVFTHPSNHTPTLREALTAALAVQP